MGTTFDTLNPATGQVIASFPVCGRSEVDAAVLRAGEAASWWAALGWRERRIRLLTWKSAITRRMADLARLVHEETGKPVADAKLEIILAIVHLDWAAKHAQRILGPRRVRSGLAALNHAATVEYQPFGVVGVIGPWNYPVFTPMGSIAYALAAGNAVVFKPSEFTPATGDWLVTSFASTAGRSAPQPVLQLLTGSGQTGAALASSAVGKIAFTGSAATARKVMAAAAANLTPVIAECGGKDALIIDDGADLDAAADAAAWGALSNAGQTCIGVERAYVTAPVYEAFLAKLSERTSRVRPGSGPGADYGPMTMPGQADVIARHLSDAIARGGRALVPGASRPSGDSKPSAISRTPEISGPSRTSGASGTPDGGAAGGAAADGGTGAIDPPYVRPVILTNVPEDAAVMTEETFGPVITVTKVRDLAEAVRLANASRYALGSAVFTKGRQRAMRAARDLRSGMTAINSVIAFALVPALPFGGSGESGFGRIHGADGLREFCRAKAITRQRMRPPVNLTSFGRTETDLNRVTALIRFLHGRRDPG
jgi:acyl-CoA reductase-like NAD-dependent aldehyde dehydrogenase